MSSRLVDKEPCVTPGHRTQWGMSRAAVQKYGTGTRVKLWFVNDGLREVDVSWMDRPLHHSVEPARNLPTSETPRFTSSCWFSGLCTARSHFEPNISAVSVPALTIHVHEVSESLVLSFDAVNVSSSEISVTPAFGYDFYFNLEIENEDGIPVHVPAWEIAREIRGRCLRRGEKISLRVPLESWDVVVGTDAKCTEEPCFRVQLPAVYRVRVRYRPVPQSTLRSGCASVPMIVTSEWFGFEVRKRD